MNHTPITRRTFLASTSAAIAAAAIGAAPAEHPITRYGAKPDDPALSTPAIQAAIDACAAAGGGTVRIPKGKFITGALQLKDKICLIFDEGAVLQGSDDWRQYGEGKWLDALITARDARDIRIEGPGLIDGADCRNPKGEEGFRGPHAILMVGCKDIVIQDLTITRAANYAILCRNSADAKMHKVAVRAGHDGVHAQACDRFRVTHCDFRTGDDCLAGCDNTDFQVLDCKINSSCNGFRLGCQDLIVRDCQFWGPGESKHRVSNRTNMLSAFVHFAPTDRNPKLPSDNWLIQNITIDNADAVYGYDFEKGLWQTGQPAKRLRFENVKATRIANPLRIRGDADRQFALTLDRVSIALRDDRADQEVLQLSRFGSLVLREVTLQNNGKKPILRATDGNTVWLDRVTALPENAAPYVIEQVEKIRRERFEG